VALLVLHLAQVSSYNPWRHCVRGVFLLENSALKFKWCGETKQIHDIKKKSKENFITSIMSQDLTQCFEYCNMLPLTFDHIV